MKLYICALFLVCCTIIIEGKSYRILGLFPHPGISHFYVFRPLLLGLANAGHNVTVFSHFPETNPPANYRDFKLPGQVLKEGIDFQGDWFKNRQKYGFLTEFLMTYEWAKESCQLAYSSPDIQQLIMSNEKYDLVIMEYFITDCLIGIPWKLNVPVIGISTCPLLPWLYDRIGTPFIPSFMPSFFVDTGDKMSFYYRFRNFIDHHLTKFIQRSFHGEISNKILKEQFGPNIPAAEDLVKNTSLIFVNTHYSLSGSKPISPALIEIGGIHLREPQSLEQNIKEFLDNAMDGVIYVNWGSMVRADTMPTEKINSLIKAFGAFRRQKVLWKLETELENKPENVYIHKWLQQQEILCHPNVKVFLSHGGLLGSTEAASCGTPVVVTPLFGDQFYNGASLVQRGMGKIVHYENITFESITEAINFALHPTIQENAKKVAFEFNHRIATPLETAIWWVEHVIETGGAPFIKAYSIQLPWYVYHLIDVYGVLFGIFIGCLMLFLWIINKCYCKNDKKRSKDKIN